MQDIRSPHYPFDGNYVSMPPSSIELSLTASRIVGSSTSRRAGCRGLAGESTRIVLDWLVGQGNRVEVEVSVVYYAAL